MSTSRRRPILCTQSFVDRWRALPAGERASSEVHRDQVGPLPVIFLISGGHAPTLACLKCLSNIIYPNLCKSWATVSPIFFPSILLEHGKMILLQLRLAPGKRSRKGVMGTRTATLERFAARHETKPSIAPPPRSRRSSAARRRRRVVLVCNP